MNCEDYKIECKGHGGIMLNHCGECNGCEHEYKATTLPLLLGVDPVVFFDQCKKCAWTPVGPKPVEPSLSKHEMGQAIKHAINRHNDLKAQHKSLTGLDWDDSVV